MVTMALVRTSDAALVWAKNEVEMSEVVDVRPAMDKKKSMEKLN